MSLRIFLIFTFLFFTLLFQQSSYGHGLSSETLPTKRVGDVEVTLFAHIKPQSDLKQLGIELFDTHSRIPTSETTYHVKLIKNNKTVFEESFLRSNVGLLIDLLPTSLDKTTLEETSDVTEQEAMFGISKKVKASSPVFVENGLYLLEVKILTLGSFENYLDNPPDYEFGLSVPDAKTLEIEDKIYGNQKINLISYYDEINGLDYDSQNKVLLFDVPFDWTDQTIDQTFVVHQEIIIPNNFSPLISSNYTAFLNDIKLSNDILTIDDFSEDNRIVHFIINQKDLLELNNIVQNKDSSLRFSLKTTSDISSTEIIIPDWIKKNSKWWAQGMINDSDFSQGIEFMIQEKIIEIPNLPNSLATDVKPIPLWVKNNAGWWADGLISDDDFVLGIKFLVKQGIIRL